MFCGTSDPADYLKRKGKKMTKDLMKLETEFEDLWTGEIKERCRDSLAPAFIYMILEDHTSRHVHYTQADILEKLEEYPYELTLTRQSVGRILNTLAAAGKIRWSQVYGAWVE